MVDKKNNFKKSTSTRYGKFFLNHGLDISVLFDSEKRNKSHRNINHQSTVEFEHRCTQILVNKTCTDGKSISKIAYIFIART